MAKSDKPPTLAQATGRNVERLRTQRGLSQDVLAAKMLRYGFEWGRSVVAAVESGRRALEIGEALVVAKELGVELGDLLVGEVASETVTLAPLVRVDVAALRALFAPGVSGLSLYTPMTSTAMDEAASHQEAELKAARKLRVEPRQIVSAARSLWGRSLTAERDARVGPDANHATRGHVTRQLVAEIKKRLQEEK